MERRLIAAQRAVGKAGLAALLPDPPVHVQVIVGNGDNYRITLRGEREFDVWFIPTRGAPANLGPTRSAGAAAWAVLEHGQEQHHG